MLTGNVAAEGVGVTVAVVVVWGVLCGAAYWARSVARLSRRRCLLVVTGCYVALAALALAWFGLTRNGALGAFGMGLPYAVAIGLVLVPLGRGRGRIAPDGARARSGDGVRETSDGAA